MLFGCCIKGGADWHLQFGPLLRAVHGAKGPCAARHSVAAAKLASGWGGTTILLYPIETITVFFLT